jgi:hypothetical protein
MSTLIAAVSKAVTTATASGVLTVDSTTPIWPGQIGWLSKTGQTSLRIQVVEIISATTFRARAIPVISGDNFAKLGPQAAGTASPAGYPTNSFSDLSAFTTSGQFDAEPQVVGDNSDGGKLVRA